MTRRASKAVEAEARRRLDAANGDVHAAFLRAIKDGQLLQGDVGQLHDEIARLKDELEAMSAKPGRTARGETRDRVYAWATANWRQHRSLAAMSRALAPVMAKAERTVLGHLYDWNEENDRFPLYRWK